HGHTHRPARHPFQVDRRACERIVLGDWYSQGSVLAARGGTLELQTIRRD
ncbi:MAG: UDP-2,3-diacylglucosamine diphosphatase, partial [Gammaproteobacteria bacterium HGW-Gammaproteobacteria-8]